MLKLIMWFKKAAYKIGIDGTIGFTLLTRLVQAVGSFGVIIIIAKHLTGSEQGYYYTFASIIAIQVFFELGLSSIITQYAAHEFVHLKWDGTNQLIGESYYKSRLSSLLHFCLKWFGIVSSGLFAILIIVGFYFFTNFNKNSNVIWQTPWILLCATTSLNLLIDPILAFYEGMGDVKDMAKLRLLQKSLYIIFLFIFFSIGFKLYSSPLASLLSIAVNYLQLIFSKRFKLLKAIWLSLSKDRIEYMKEIFPYQWKIAISWISGYFIFQLFNPVLFAIAGAKVAGQMGMTLQVLNGVSALSMSWISTKIPLFSSYIATKNFDQLDVIFNITLKQLALVNILLLIMLVGFIFGLNFFALPLANRFLSTTPVILLCILTFANQYIFSWAVYLRCHKQEPFLIVSLVSGLFCTASTLILGNYFGLYGVVIGYSTITIGISLPWAYYIFRSKRIQWHLA